MHRDVKPANVLLARGDHAYLTDFGLTKQLGGESATRSGHWVGTLGYVAPEQIRGERVDARADVYALGCVLFHALTGHAPFQRENDTATLFAHINDDAAVGARRRCPRSRPRFDAVLGRALAKDPDDRYQSAGDLGRAALAAAGTAPTPGYEHSVAVGAAAPDGHGELPTMTAGTRHVPASEEPTARGARPAGAGGAPRPAAPAARRAGGARAGRRRGGGRARFGRRRRDGGVDDEHDRLRKPAGTVVRHREGRPARPASRSPAASCG